MSIPEAVPEAVPEADAEVISEAAPGAARQATRAAAREAGPEVEGSSWDVPCGLRVHHSSAQLPSGGGGVLASIAEALDERRGMLAHFGPGRVVGYVDPPIELTVRGGELAVRALNRRGRVLLPLLARVVDSRAGSAAGAGSGEGTHAEEQRTRRPRAFAKLRSLIEAVSSDQSGRSDQAGRPGPLGLYGAFGYDLVLQLEDIERHHGRAADDRTLVLHLPDEIVEVDVERDVAVRHRYEFSRAFGRGGGSGVSTEGLPRRTRRVAYRPGSPEVERDHQPGEYAELVTRTQELFRAGKMFEAVPGQEFRRAAGVPPSVLFRRLYEHNPSPYALLMNLGAGEYLVGASPEMFVRVRRDAGDELVVESAPISGTIARGADALEDAERIRSLLASAKDEAELTMCTDVDRNDKAKVCRPGTVRVTARRRIEQHATLIHTVDHVQGTLRPDADALDAFLAHLWAVTVTGAPKLAAMRFLERAERSPRRWYGGATGRIGFDGTLETSLTLRTIQVRDGVATVRAGATLLYASDPAGEEAETELKAKALLEVLEASEASEVSEGSQALQASRALGAPGSRPRRVLMVDHQDSFVHCLADYFRQAGAEVATYRPPHHLGALAGPRPDLLVLSPGPGRPADFGIAATVAEAVRLGVPVFGVCLGLQGVVEYFGGSLDLLGRPAHGHPSVVRVTDPRSELLDGLPETFEVGRYHSLYAKATGLPPDLRAVAVTDDGIAMAVEHTELPVSAVQFHPESIMTARGGIGHRLVANALTALTSIPSPTNPRSRP